jgi:hypothetical protein
MEGLYPIIRRVRRPLLSAVANPGPVAPDSQVGSNVLRENATTQIIATAIPALETTSATRSDARRHIGKKKAA